MEKNNSVNSMLESIFNKVRIDYENLQESLEHINHHNESAMIEAIKKGRFAALIELAQITIKHEKIGYLPFNLFIKRTKILKELATQD